MCRPIRETDGLKRSTNVMGVLLACAFALLLAAGAAPAVAQEYDGGDGGASQRASFAAGEAAADALGAQGEDDAITSGEIGTCVWEIDANGKLTISPAEGESGTLCFDGALPTEEYGNTRLPPWYPYCNDITSAEVRGLFRLPGTGAGCLQTVSSSSASTCPDWMCLR